MLPGWPVRADQAPRRAAGFQVLLTGYPELQRQLDLDALGLAAFRAGALLQVAGRFEELCDPLRHPAGAVSTALAKVGSLGDKLRVLRMWAQVRATSPHYRGRWLQDDGRRKRFATR